MTSPPPSVSLKVRTYLQSRSLLALFETKMLFLPHRYQGQGRNPRPVQTIPREARRSTQGVGCRSSRGALPQRGVNVGPLALPPPRAHCNVKDRLTYCDGQRRNNLCIHTRIRMECSWKGPRPSLHAGWRIPSSPSAFLNRPGKGLYPDTCLFYLINILCPYLSRLILALLSAFFVLL